MAEPQEIAKRLLTERGLVGNLNNVAGDWQLRGERGGQGVAVMIRGSLDEAVLTQAADMIAGEFAQPVN